MTNIDGLLTFSINPFAVRSAFLPPLAMQVYIALMIVAVALGTLVERLHQGSTTILIVDSKRIF